MNRVKDYIRFAVRFVGLGYLVLWPLELSPGLHLIGVLSTMSVTAWAILRLMRRPRTSVIDALFSGETSRPTPERPRWVQPRSHFGLRGARR